MARRLVPSGGGAKRSQKEDGTSRRPPWKNLYLQTLSGFKTMKVKLFTIVFSPEHERFDTREMDEFLANKEVRSVKEYFFEHQGLPYCTLLVTYCDSSSTTNTRNFSSECHANHRASDKNAERIRALTESQFIRSTEKVAHRKSQTNRRSCILYCA